jgi:hypothetical protein
MATIPLWAAYGHHAIAIEVHKTENASSYQAAITIVLDDGEELPENPDDHKGLTLFLDFYGENPEQTIGSVAMLLGQLFQNIMVKVFEFDEKGESVKEYNLEKVMKSFHKKNEAKSKSNVTFSN